MALARAVPPGLTPPTSSTLKASLRKPRAGYQKLIEAGQPSGVLYYNLGNAWFKAGQYGRAIAAYLQAQRLNPRDPNLRFNLRFVREKVTGKDAPVGTAWQRALTALTLNEWVRLCAAMFWGWFLLLTLREVRPAWRKPLRPYVALAGVATLLLAIGLTAAWRQSQVRTAVVVRSEAVVRQGPLDRSPSPSNCATAPSWSCKISRKSATRASSSSGCASRTPAAGSAG